LNPRHHFSVRPASLNPVKDMTF